MSSTKPVSALASHWAKVSHLLRVPRVARSLVLFALLGILQASLGPLIPVLAARHHLGQDTAGLLVSVFFVGSLVSIVGGSVLGERHLGHRVITGLIVLISAGTLSLVFVPSWLGQLTGVTIAGLGFGLLTLIVNADMASHPRHGVSLANLVNAAFAVGAALGPTFIGLALHADYFWSLLAVAIALITAAPWRAPRHTAHGAADTDSAPAASIRAASGTSPVRVSVAAVVLFCLLLALYPAVETGLSTWETAYLDATGHPTATAAMLTSLFWGGLAAGRFAIPLAPSRWGAARIILTAFAVALLALTLIAIPTLAPVGFLFGGVAAGPVKPSALAWIASHSTQPRRMDGLTMASAMLGNITLPAGIGYIMAATTERLLPALVASAVLASIMLTLALHMSLTHRTHSRRAC